MSPSQDNEEDFQSESLNISARFQNIRDEVLSQYGYDQDQSKPGGSANSTQELFAARTKLQCDSEFMMWAANPHLKL